jgi:hypothetical protein
MYNIITGEIIQKKCDLYLSDKYEDFLCNPNIAVSPKNILLNQFNEEFENPKYIFCYIDVVKYISSKLEFFKNPFVLISGNGDYNIEYEDIIKIVKIKNLTKWYTQNLSFDHSKIIPLPIGIANSQWPHGNLIEFEKIISNLPVKINNIYFSFNINTNPQKRQICFNELSNYLDFLPHIAAVENWKRLASYKFCVCPEGNGLDSHRIWECYYLKVVPIVLDCEFIRILKKHIDIPMLILQKWTDLIGTILNYEDYKFPDKNLDIDEYIKVNNNI